MAEVLAEYDTIVRARDGSRWAGRAVGRERDDAVYEAWIEFVPVLGTEPPLRTGRETTQSDRAAAHYWADGITPAYLEGALERARPHRAGAGVPAARPLFASPATAGGSGHAPRSLRAIIDPFAVHAQDDGRLAAQLDALSTDHLRDIAIVYELAPMDRIFTCTRVDLVHLIVDAARNEDAARSDLR